MKDLLDYMLKALLGEAKYEILESEDDGRTIYSIKTDADQVGLIIGKGGRIIKSLRNLLKVRATLEKKAVALNIAE